MQVQVIDTTGKKTGKVSLPNEIFSVKPSPKLLAQAVRVYLANQRQGTAKVKSRGEVRGSGRKIWRQKGTGRARHGDRYAPIFVGGGVSHGPTGEQQHKLTLSKKMRRKALFAALTSKIEGKKLLVVDGLERLEPKTGRMDKILNKLVSKSPEKISIVLSEKADSVIRGARNIQRVNLLSANQLNAYEVLNSGTIILMKEAIEPIRETFLAKGKKIIKLTKSQKQKPKKKQTTEAEPKTSRQTIVTKKTATKIIKRKKRK